jgi:hypothetical protein
MLAMFLSVGLFVFWTVVGHALISVVRRQATMRDHLLAPTFGIACTVLPVYVLNRLGLPVGSFAWALFIALAVASAAVFIWARVPFDFRGYRPFAFVLLAALFLVGFPLLEFGFEWVSYCNNDMANYCNAALRFHDFGFDEVPRQEQLLGGADYPQFYWFFHSVMPTRPGADLVLAWIAGLTGLAPVQIFMPVTVAFHLCLVAAAGALVYQARSFHWQAWWTCFLLALSALAASGVFQQLIAQVVGLAILAGLAVLLLRPFDGWTIAETLREGLLTGILGTSLLVVYPEVIPLIGLGFILHRVLLWRDSIRAWRPLAGCLAVAIAVWLGVLNVNALRPVEFLFAQAVRGEVVIRLSTIFNYYLMPAGLANLWGFVPVGMAGPPEPFNSMLIGLGGLLVAVAIVATIALVRKGQPAALIMAVMFVLALILFQKPDGFGLFKLAMFAQPFLLATLVVWCWQVVSWRWLKFIPLVALGIGGLYVQHCYRQASRGIARVYVEIPRASTDHLVGQIQALKDEVGSRRLLCDASQATMIKLVSHFIRGNQSAFPSCMSYYEIAGSYQQLNYLDEHACSEDAVRIDRELNKCISKHQFDLHDPSAPGLTNAFMLNDLAWPKTDDYLLLDCQQMTVWNRHAGNCQSGRFFALRDAKDVHNHLLYVYSGLARVNPISQFSFERDVIYPERNMVGCGRHLLFQVLKPSDHFRVRLDLTASLRADLENRLPRPCAIGDERVPFATQGRGAARVFSKVLTPQWIEGHACVGLDMQEEGKLFAILPEGLAKLYGTKYRRDCRELVAFLRDVSLVTEEQYAALAPPTSLSKFPRDLLHDDLEFSGIYEDGWLSEASFFKLARPAGAAALVLRGMIPKINDGDFKTVLSVRLDGKLVATHELGLGKFEVQIPPGEGAGRAHVELAFSHWQSLPQGDRRPVTALVSFLGFTNSAAVNDAR